MHVFIIYFFKPAVNHFGAAPLVASLCLNCSSERLLEFTALHLTSVVEGKVFLVLCEETVGASEASAFLGFGKL